MKHTAKSAQHSTASEDALDWRESTLARQVEDIEAPIISKLCADLFGYQLLQVGIHTQLLNGLEQCAIPGKTLVLPTPAAVGSNTIVALADALPVASDCIDVVVMPHTLDFVADPRQVLREVDRVPIPEGRLVMSGFNPFSLWGMRRVFRRMRNRQPWKAHFISMHRLQDWLSLLGFDIEQIEMRLFRPPLSSPASMRTLRGMEQLGQRFWPVAGATYIIRAVKRESIVTPVRRHWRLEQSIRKRAVEPTGTAGCGNVLPFSGKLKTND